MGKDRFSIGEIPPTPVLVDQYFNDSTGVGDEGETDSLGPWNEGGNWEIVEAPQLEQGVENLDSADGGKPVQRGKRLQKTMRSLENGPANYEGLPLISGGLITAIVRSQQDALNHGVTGRPFGMAQHSSGIAGSRKRHVSYRSAAVFEIN